MATVLVKRPVAFRIPRVIDDKLSNTEWRYFTDEEAAYKESEALGIDYQALYVRDGTAIVQARDQVAAEVIEQCARIAEIMAEEQDATNKKYPDHANAYPNWVDRVYHFRNVARNIRCLALKPRGGQTREEIEEDDPEVAIVARAIAENGFTRPWDDFLPVNVFDTDQDDLIEYAKAAVAAMRLIAMSKPRGEPAREGGEDVAAGSRPKLGNES